MDNSPTNQLADRQTRRQSISPTKQLANKSNSRNWYIYVSALTAGANIPYLPARTCLEIRNPCLKIRKWNFWQWNQDRSWLIGYRDWFQRNRYVVGNVMGTLPSLPFLLFISLFLLYIIHFFFFIHYYFLLFYLEWTRNVCWPRLTYKRVEPVVSISWASC